MSGSYLQSVSGSCGVPTIAIVVDRKSRATDIVTSLCEI